VRSHWRRNGPSLAGGLQVRSDNRYPATANGLTNAGGTATEVHSLAETQKLGSTEFPRRTVGHRENFRVFWSTLFRSSGRLLLMAFQFLYCRGHISVSAIVILPSPCVDVFPPTKQPSKECDSLSGTFRLVHRGRQLSGFGWKRILWHQLRNGNAVNRQEPPQASILVAETNIFLLWRFEWKSV